MDKLKVYHKDKIEYELKRNQNIREEI